MTETGLSLGTPHYMSPEQATAEKDLTSRSDVYSLGSVLYEMLTGEPPHMGNSAQQIIMKIVTDTPRPVTELRKSVPPNVSAAVAQALEKLAADRFDSAKAFAEALANPAFTLPTTHAMAVAGAPIRGPWNWLSIATTTLAAVLVVVTLWISFRPAPVMPVSRYRLLIPDGAFMSPGAGLALSPDGTQFVYPALVDGVVALWVKRSDQLHGSPISGTENGFLPVISPDGSQVVFLTFGGDVAIKRVALDGGQPVTVVDSGVGTDGLAWGHDGFLYYDGLTATGTTGIIRVPDTGGVPERVTSVDTAQGETDHTWPQVLPNGRGVLFEIHRSSDRAESDVAVLDLATDEYRVLVRGLAPRFVAPRYLVFSTEDGLLMAAPFDPDRLELAGEAVAMTEEVELGPQSDPAASLTLSAAGTLMYVGGTTQWRMTWIDRDGGTEDLGTVEDVFTDFSNMALSPDGTQLAISRAEQEDVHIWIKQLPRGPPRKLTFEGKLNIGPRWTPNGRDIVFVSNRSGNGDLYTTPADGSSLATLLLDADQPITYGFFPGDEWLVYADASGDISAVPWGRDSVTVPLLTTQAFEVAPQLSPDGRWLAYMSDESGQMHVYVRPFPNVTATRYLTSTEMGWLPMWAHSGNELFYVNLAGELVVVEVRPGPPFSVGERRPLFRVPQGGVFLYDVGPDDQRFLVLRPETVDGDRELIVVENWVEELKARVGN
jgi:serine/threonine-protein kinase